MMRTKVFLKRIRNKAEVQAEKAYNLGFQAHVMGNLEEAISHYVNCLEHDPHHFAALNNLAGTYAHLNDYNKARDCLEQALFGTRGIPMIYYNLGLLFLALEQYDQSIDAFKKTLELNPDHFWAQVNLAEILVDRVQLQDAIGLYQQAVEKAPDAWLIKIRLVELYYLEKDYQTAEFMLRDTLSHRETPEGLYNLAWLLLIQNKCIPEAIQLFQKARLKKAPYKEALFNQAIAESINENFEDSLAHMQSFTGSTSRGETSILVKNFRTLARVNANNIAAVMKIATHLFDEGHDEEAISELLLLLKRKPDNLPALKLLSQYEFQSGGIEMAIETCQRILALAPEKEALDAYILLARIYGSREDFDEAMGFIEQALRIDPMQIELNYQYATFMAQKGDFHTALKHYKQIAATSPSFPRIQNRIRMVEEELRESGSS